MDGALGSAAQGGMLTADRAWVRWGVTAAVTGMLAWVVGVALIPLDAKLDKGSQHLEPPRVRWRLRCFGFRNDYSVLLAD